MWDSTRNVNTIFLTYNCIIPATSSCKGPIMDWFNPKHVTTWQKYTEFTWMQDDSDLWWPLPSPPQIKHVCQGKKYLSKSKTSPQKWNTPMHTLTHSLSLSVCVCVCVCVCIWHMDPWKEWMNEWSEWL